MYYFSLYGGPDSAGTFLEPDASFTEMPAIKASDFWKWANSVLCYGYQNLSWLTRLYKAGEYLDICF